MFFHFAAEVPLRWVDVDSAGVVNNATYMSLMEQARFLYFQHLGLMVDHTIPFVLAEANVKFLRPGRLPMRCGVAARVSKLGTSSFHMDFEVTGDENVLVTSTAVLVFIDKDLRPRPIPEDWRAAILQFEQLKS
jgi:acyl-CoA thioester hydrolase